MRHPLVLVSLLWLRLLWFRGENLCDPSLIVPLAVSQVFPSDSTQELLPIKSAAFPARLLRGVNTAKSLFIAVDGKSIHWPRNGEAGGLALKAPSPINKDKCFIGKGAKGTEWGRGQGHLDSWKWEVISWVRVSASFLPFYNPLEFGSVAGGTNMMALGKDYSIKRR